MVISESVDSAIYRVLDGIDNQFFPLSFTASDGRTVDLEKDGGMELAGWYIGWEGWIWWYSKERYRDLTPGFHPPGKRPGADENISPPEPVVLVPEVEEFGRILASWVRDSSIRDSHRELDSGAGSLRARHWQIAISRLSWEEFAWMVIPDVVDITIMKILQAIDEGVLHISYAASSGNTVDLTKDGRGHLRDRYGGRDGWRNRYSKKRFNDYGAE